MTHEGLTNKKKTFLTIQYECMDSAFCHKGILHILDIIVCLLFYI